MLAGPTGLGKTTIMGQIGLHGIGVRSGLFLDLDVSIRGRVLYVAADRPYQIRRSFRRMVAMDDRDLLNRGLIAHFGPPPFRLDSPTQKPNALLTWLMADWKGEDGALHEGLRPGDAVMIDSLKDVVTSLTADEGALRAKEQFNEVLMGGIELAIGHHTRKEMRVEGGKEPPVPTVDDIYGNSNYTNSAGSVILLRGRSGTSRARLLHVKQPADVVGPFDIVHDHEVGRSTIDGSFQVGALGEKYDATTERVYNALPATLAELVATLGISSATVRRHLAELTVARRVRETRAVAKTGEKRYEPADRDEEDE
jgi:replicative DNA helicase